jgi:dsDNA-binding SOS-regulon protein
MTTMQKKDADAYDRMLDAAEQLAELIEAGGIDIDEDALEELTIFLAEHGLVVGRILKNLKYSWP